MLSYALSYNLSVDTMQTTYHVGEVAQTTGFSEEHIRRAIRKGELKAAGTRFYRISRIELQRWWEAMGGGELSFPDRRPQEYTAIFATVRDGEIVGARSVTFKAENLEDAYDNAPEICAGAPGLPEGCQLVGLLLGLPHGGLINGMGFFRKGGTGWARHF